MSVTRMNAHPSQENTAAAGESGCVFSPRLQCILVEREERIDILFVSVFTAVYVYVCVLVCKCAYMCVCARCVLSARH